MGRKFRTSKPRGRDILNQERLPGLFDPAVVGRKFGRPLKRGHTVVTAVVLKRWSSLTHSRWLRMSH
jgi:hypothetical protein